LTNQAEWVELINNSVEMINLKDCKIAEVLPELETSLISEEDLFIPPGQFVVMATDSTINGLDENARLIVNNFGTLGNTGDGIVIYDFRNAVIDSLFYDPDWGYERGVSLERISLESLTNDPWNWILSISQNGSTPGYENSILNAPRYEQGVVVINEIMYDPQTDNSEFIELFNRSEDFIELGGWVIQDGNNDFISVSNKSLLLPPNEYYIISADSSILLNYNWLAENENISILNSSGIGLANNGEALSILDIYGNVIDSVFYSEEWNSPNVSFTKNKSLERLNPVINSNDPSNWSTSVSDVGATPNRQNSIFLENPFTSAQINITPNPFSPDDDGYEDFSVVNYNLTQSIAQIRIKVYDSKGRKVRTLVSNKSSGASGSVIFDGLDENGNPLRMGIYILFMEALNSSSGVVETMKKPVVIARKL